MRATRTYGLTLAAVMGLALAAPVDAQEVTGQFTVAPSGGYFMFDDAAALDDFAAVGMDVTYHVNEMVGVGIYFDASRPTSIGEHYAPARHVYPDTIFLFAVSQQVTTTNYGLAARVRVPLGMMSAAAMAGLGRYTIFADPEINRRAINFSGTQFMAGAGLEFAIGQRSGIRAEIRDYVYTDYDRELLNPVHPAHRDATWPELREGVPEPKDTIHNLRFSLGFMFIPGSR